MKSEIWLAKKAKKNANYISLGSDNRKAKFAKTTIALQNVIAKKPNCFRKSSLKKYQANFKKFF